MSENLRVYRRELALFALAGAKESLTAAELAEHMATLSQNEEHGEHCWRGIDAITASGILRSLENEGLVAKDEPKRDKRAGEDRPTWRYALGSIAAKLVRLPDPPPKGASLASQLRQPPQNPYEDLSRPQLYAMLEVGDLAMQELARLQQQGYQTLQHTLEVNGRMRRILVDAGLGDRLP